MAQAKSSTPRKRSAAPVNNRPPAKRARNSSRNQHTSSVINTAPTTRLDVYVFGAGGAGELGLGPKNATDVTSPRLNANLDAEKVGVVDVATGGMHAVALTHDGKVLTWGVNDNLALGRETDWEEDDDASDDSVTLNPYESTPTAIPAKVFAPGTRIVQVAAGDNASFALTQDGLVYGWGTFVSNKGKPSFPLDKNRVVPKQKAPILIPGLERIVQISAGDNFCLALSADGKVYSWGRSEQHQLGRRLIVDRSAAYSEKKLDDLYARVGLLPGLVPFSPRRKIVSVHAGSDHAFAIDSNGDTWAWGLNNYGQTGIRTGAGLNGATSITPQRVQSLIGKKMKTLQGGIHHSIGVTQSGECIVWGRMDGAQIGVDINTLPLDDPKKVISENGKPRILLEPTVLPITNCSFVAAGSDHNILITSGGSAYSWGFNDDCQCGQGSNTDDILTATLLDCSSIRGKLLSWAGAGGQYSMVAGPCT